MENELIPKENLIEGMWYLGEGRNSNIALWHQGSFHTFGRFYKGIKEKKEDYYEETRGTFKPYIAIGGLR